MRRALIACLQYETERRAMTTAKQKLEPPERKRKKRNLTEKKYHSQDAEIVGSAGAKSSA